MTELKTLKDLEYHPSTELVTHKMLKQEAIKWVKQFKLNEFGVLMVTHTNAPEWFDEKYSKLYSEMIDRDSKYCATRLFMNFFNLTEEDLK